MSGAASQTFEILLDDARPGHERLRIFRGLDGIVEAFGPEEVAGALAALEQARKSGRYVAGYFAYELGYILEPALRPLLPKERTLPLLRLGVFKACEILTDDAAQAELKARVTGRAYAGPLAHEWDAAAYGKRFARVHRYIGAGDIYQANLSFRSHFSFVGDPMALYLKLRERSAAAHGAFIADGERHILSLSPELFFSVSAQGEITAKPMKGTAPRGSDPAQDTAARAHLQTSEKERAENLMIVDLLRNDLGRVATMGSVSVPDLFSVETYPTVHQMVSTVRARLREGATVEEILRALFPCGSVTGAPKIRAMQIIRELEQSPRGVYCGAIGHFSPDGMAQFNVAIRTLTLANNRGELGIGGAVVHDSRAQNEYDECLLKARYYNSVLKPVELIETLRFSREQEFTRLNLHLERMERSAKVFGISFDQDAAMRELDRSVAGFSEDLRARLVLDQNGLLNASAAPLGTEAQLWTYRLSEIPVASGDVLLAHKTSWREMFEASSGQTQGCDEVLFVNERGELTEGSRTNVFIRIGGRLFTPPKDSGLLPGCLRRELIESGECSERVLYPSDLANAEAVFLGNSLRGLIPSIPA